MDAPPPSRPPFPSRSQPVRRPLRLKKYACERCGRKFDRPSSRETHYLTHTGEKPYECPQCGMRFTTPSNVNRHLRTLRHSRSPSSSGQDSSSDSASLGEGFSLEDVLTPEAQASTSHRMPSMLAHQPAALTSTNFADWNRGGNPQTPPNSLTGTLHAYAQHSNTVRGTQVENIPELPTQASWGAFFPPSGSSSSSLSSYPNYTEIQSNLGPGPVGSSTHLAGPYVHTAMHTVDERGRPTLTFGHAQPQHQSHPPYHVVLPPNRMGLLEGQNVVGECLHEREAFQIQHDADGPEFCAFGELPSPSSHFLQPNQTQ